MIQIADRPLGIFEFIQVIAAQASFFSESILNQGRVVAQVSILSGEVKPIDSINLFRSSVFLMINIIVLPYFNTLIWIIADI